MENKELGNFFAACEQFGLQRNLWQKNFEAISERKG
jgi:hypothetical protein